MAHQARCRGAGPRLGLGFPYRNRILARPQERTSAAYELPLWVKVNGGSDVAHMVRVLIPAERRAIVALPGSFTQRPTSLVFDPDSLLLARIGKL